MLIDYGLIMLFSNKCNGLRKKLSNDCRQLLLAATVRPDIISNCLWNVKMTRKAASGLWIIKNAPKNLSQIVGLSKQMLEVCPVNFTVLKMSN